MIDYACPRSFFKSAAPSSAYINFKICTCTWKRIWFAGYKFIVSLYCFSRICFSCIVNCTVTGDISQQLSWPSRSALFPLESVMRTIERLDQCLLMSLLRFLTNKHMMNYHPTFINQLYLNWTIKRQCITKFELK